MAKGKRKEGLEIYFVPSLRYAPGGWPFFRRVLSARTWELKILVPSPHAQRGGWACFCGSRTWAKTWDKEIRHAEQRREQESLHGNKVYAQSGRPFTSFSALAGSISDSLPNARAVIDGEICSLHAPSHSPCFAG